MTTPARVPRRTTLLAALVVAAALLLGGGHAQPANYTDPLNYPFPWPSDFTSGCSGCWRPYTYKGENASDRLGSNDGSNGGTTPQQEVDIVNDPNGVSVYYYANGANLYFRLVLNGPPGSFTGSGQPYKSANWSILLDTTGDGYRNFVVMLLGADSGLAPDDIYVMYNTTKSQAVSQATDTIWRQDSARHPARPNNVDGEPDGSSIWDVDPDPYVWDFSRTRVVQINRSANPEAQNSRYYLDIQVPLAAFDATGRGGPRLTPTSWFGLAYTTANSNTNPAQKDFAFPGDYVFTNVNNPLPFGDTVDASGNTTQKPLVASVTAGTCSASVPWTADVVDTVEPYANGLIRTTVRSVEYYYLRDDNGNGRADPGETWVLAQTLTMNVTPTTVSVTGGAVTNNIGPWIATWNPTALPQGAYLLKVVARDDQGNVTDSSATTGALANPYGERIATFANTCGTAAADLALTKTAAPNPTVAGTDVTYTLTVTNAGPNPAQNVVLGDALPAGTSFVSCSAPGGTCGGSGTSRTITYPSLAAGATVTATIVARVAPSVPAGTTIVNTATVTSSTLDPHPGNNTGVASHTVAARADLAIVKTATPNPAVAGTELTYTLTVTNAGPSDAQAVILRDDLNPNLQFVSCTAPGGSCGGTGANRTASFGTLPAGASATVTIVARVNPNVTSGSSIPNTATVTSSTPDPNAANDSSTVQSPVTTRADLGIVKTATPEPVVAGTNVTYTLVITNAGPSAAAGVLARDTLPSGLAFVSCTTTVGTCGGNDADRTVGIGSLAPGASVTASIVARVAPDRPHGSSITNTATVTSTTPDPDPANDTSSATSTVTTLADLALTKRVGHPFAAPGDTILYTIDVTNHGPSDTHAVRIRDVLPPGFSAAATTNCLEDLLQGTNGLPICTLGTIRAGSTVGFTIRAVVQAPLGTVLTNVAEVEASSAPDPNSTPANDDPNENDRGTATLTVSGIELTKRVCNRSRNACDTPERFTLTAAGEPGEELEYRIAYRNVAAPAFDVLVTDPVPLDTTLVTNAFPPGAALEVHCPDGAVQRLSSDSTTSVTVDLASICSLATATRADGSSAPALLPGETGDIRFRVRIR